MISAYAIKNYQEMNSSSGGAFPSIVNAYSKSFKDDNIIVYGAAFSDDFSVKHVRVPLSEGLSQLYESKYVRSSLGNVVDNIIDDIRLGCHVLFCGTPCQVHSIKNYMKKISPEALSNLFTIDLICHGTPKSELWEQVVSLIKSTGDVSHISFRHRSKTKNDLQPFIEYADGRKTHNPELMREYMRIFHSELSLYNSCFSCMHRNSEINRPGDITIGDFWGIREIVPSMKDMEPVSLVITNTDSGEIVFNQIDDAVIVKKLNNDEFIKYNPHLNVQNTKPDKYDQFWIDFKTCSTDVLLKKYGSENYMKLAKYKIGRVLYAIGIKGRVKRVIRWCRQLV